MRCLFYTNYESGRSGLSNAIMSIEIGVVLAHLTNRFLVLDGNASPPANIVSYDARVDNSRPSRVTDLIDIPVPWAEPGAVDLEGLPSLELTERSLGQFAFYFPKTLGLSSQEARSFARGRDHWLTLSDAHERVPVLRLSEEPLVPGTRQHRKNLCFYSYQFYLNEETRRSVYRLLQRMVAKPPFAELAKRVAGELGSFNAVHLRRGDFKVTYGVTTLDRKPWEAIEAMDQLFKREEPLVILTDERGDPFFEEIKRAYPNHYFIDWHILEHYGGEFARLPQTDSLSLAYLSQLVAAESQAFLGTMTSTFTSIVQRYRGNRGKHEPFRFLWNELPEPGQGVERGRHAISDCVALEDGVMVEESAGPYSWNRVSRLLDPSWMREWPESFLTPEVLATGALPKPREDTPGPDFAPRLGAGLDAVIHVPFEELQVAVRASDAGLLQRLAPHLGADTETHACNQIANLEISSSGPFHRLLCQGESLGEAGTEADLSNLIKNQLVSIFSHARKRHAWLGGAAFAQAGRGLVVAGDVGRGDHSLPDALRDQGWELLEWGAVAVRFQDLMIVPFGVRTRPEGAAPQHLRIATPFTGLVIAAKVPLYTPEALSPITPSAAVVELIGSSLDFKLDRHRAVEGLCRLAEDRPISRLSWSRPQAAARLLCQWLGGACSGDA